MSSLRPDAVARYFPSMKIAMTHLETAILRRQAAEPIKQYANLYFDLAGSGNFLDVSPPNLRSC